MGVETPHGGGGGKRLSAATQISVLLQRRLENLVRSEAEACPLSLTWTEAKRTARLRHEPEAAGFKDGSPARSYINRQLLLTTSSLSGC